MSNRIRKRLWSSSVTRKADHHVVDAIVRQPIYTCIIVALYATAVLKASPLGIASVLLMQSGMLSVRDNPTPDFTDPTTGLLTSAMKTSV
jgi:protein-S-isoprenylcysteine O-methyltransferase Ste14